MSPSKQLASLGLKLPNVAPPVGSYVPAIRTGNLILTSGQVPFKDGTLRYAGKVGAEVSLEDARAAAEICVMNGLAAAAQVAGGFDRISRIVRVGVFVASAPGFTDQPKVANGASDMLAKIFGDAGKHARAAVGVAELPLNSSVEVELTVEVVDG
ncbi:MAG: RidA family protein [Planctomycetes bacterium]|nr:RidA family protein [Planctomycetota bacterium]